MPENSTDGEDRRRAPSKFKKVEDVDGDDIRVAVTGTIVDKEEETLIIDDGTGNLEVEFDLSEDLSDFENGDMVRIIGRPTGDTMDGEVIQDFSDFDIDLYEEALEKLEAVRKK